MKRNNLIKSMVLVAIILAATIAYRSVTAKLGEAHGTKTMGLLRTEDSQGSDPGEDPIDNYNDEAISAEEAPAGDEESNDPAERPEREIESEAIDEFGAEAKIESGKELGDTANEAPERDEYSQESFITLSSNEAIVKNYSELKNALANDNGVTAVYFSDNITMQLTGIRINPNKPQVVISGINPLDPEQTRPYILTDYSSATFTDTIYIDSAAVKSLHVRDLTIIGKNYYGSFSVLDSALLAGITITYERVNYNGPQLCHHRQGTVRIADCTIRIHGGNGGSINQEFSEVKHLVFEGRNTIDTATSAYSVFWHPLGGTFKLADDSSLTLVSPNTSNTFGVFYANGSAYNIDISIGRRAKLYATISDAVSNRTYATLSGLTVHEDGIFHLTTTKTVAANVLNMGGALRVEKGAKFIISAIGGNASYSILRQESGDITIDKDATFHITATNANWCLLNLFGRAFICNDPTSILFRNANRNIHAMNSAGHIYINAQQANYWDTVSSGSLSEPPLYRWEKTDKTNFSINGTLADGDNGNFTSLSSNYEPGDPPGIPPSAATFSMVNARVLAFGRLELAVTNPTTKSTAISGVTEPDATVQASFTQLGVNYTYPDVRADSDGIFHIPVDVALNESTVITVKSNWQYLTAMAEAVVSGEGMLAFFVPSTMEFFTTELDSSTQTVRRLHPDWEIVVTDTRRISGGWSIYARLNSEMTPTSANRPALNGSLVFVDASGSTMIMDTDTDILICKHIYVDDEEIFSVIWDENNGVLLTVKPGIAFANTVYTASISWTLVDGP